MEKWIIFRSNAADPGQSVFSNCFSQKKLSKAAEYHIAGQIMNRATTKDGMTRYQ